MFAAYLAQDRPAAERLLDQDFVFTSRQHNHIGKAAFLARCFPTAERFAVFEILHVLLGDGDGDGGVFVPYEVELTARTPPQRRGDYGAGSPDLRDPGVLRWQRGRWDRAARGRLVAAAQARGDAGPASPVGSAG